MSDKGSCFVTVVKPVVTTRCSPCYSDPVGLTLQPCSGPVQIESNTVEPIFIYGSPLVVFTESSLLAQEVKVSRQETVSLPSVIPSVIKSSTSSKDVKTAKTAKTTKTPKATESKPKSEPKLEPKSERKAVSKDLMIPTRSPVLRLTPSAPTQGWSFVANRSMSVYQLLSGVSWQAQQLGLWSSTGVLLATSSITPGQTPEENDMYVTNLTRRVTLVAGSRYFLGALVSAVTPVFGPSVVDLTYVNSVYPCDSTSIGFLFPATIDYTSPLGTRGDLVSFRALSGSPELGFVVEQNYAFAQGALSVETLEVKEVASILALESDLGVFNHLQVRKNAQIGFGNSTPNPLSTSDLDCYGSMSVAPNTGYSTNIYYDGSNFRRVKTGTGGLLKVDTTGNFGVALTPTSGIENSIVTDLYNPFRTAFGVGALMRFQSEGVLTGSYTIAPGSAVPVSTALSATTSGTAISINGTTGLITMNADGWYAIYFDALWTAGVGPNTDGGRLSYLQGSGGDQICNRQYPILAAQQTSSYRWSAAHPSYHAGVSGTLLPTFVYSNSTSVTNIQVFVNLTIRFIG